MNITYLTMTETQNINICVFSTSKTNMKYKYLIFTATTLHALNCIEIHFRIIFLICI